MEGKRPEGGNIDGLTLLITLGFFVSIKLGKIRDTSVGSNDNCTLGISLELELERADTDTLGPSLEYVDGK